MKILKTGTRCLLVFISLWISLLMIGITGCGGDDNNEGEANDNEWVGTWTLESIDGENLEQIFAEEFEFNETDLDASTDLTYELTFDNDGMMEIEYTVKFEAKGEGLNFSGEGTMKMTGTYAISGSNYTITPMNVEVTGVFKDLGLEEESDGSLDEDTGTWSRTGDTLTLNSDEGSVIVLKKR